MPTRIQSRAAGASQTLNSSLCRSLKRTRIMALPVTVVGSSSISARPSCCDFDLRLARAGGEDLVVVELLDFPPRAVRRIDAERGDRAGARRLAVLVEHAQRDDRTRAAIGDELRRGLVDLGAHRAAAVVHGAFVPARPPCRRRRGCAPPSWLSPSDEVDAAPAAQRHRVGLVERDAVEVERVDRRCR